MKKQDNLQFEAHLPQDEYEEFCHAHPLGNLLQSPRWAPVKAEWDSLRVGLRRADGSLAAACQILIRPLALSHTFWYIPHGPLLDYQEEGILELLLGQIAALARGKRCVFVRVHPPCPIRVGKIEDFHAGQSREAYPAKELDRRFSSCGFLPGERSLDMNSTIQPRFQAVIYKELWEEPPAGKVGYHLRRNERYRLSSIRADFEGLDAFSELVRKTEARQKIHLREQDYFSRILQSFGEDASLILSRFDPLLARVKATERKKTLLAEIESLGESAPKKKRGLEEQLQSVEKDLEFFAGLEAGQGENESEVSQDFSGQLFMSRPAAKPLYPAGILLVSCGRRAEMLYASSDEEICQRVPAVWQLYTEGIRAAFAKGCTRFSLGGLEGSLDDGLSQFKSHFDPQIEETAGEYDLALRPLLYRALRSLMKGRRQKILRAQRESR